MTLVAMQKYFYIILLLFSISCSSDFSSSSKLDSDDYSDKMERIETLKNEIKCYSEILDADFELFNVNGFKNSRQTVPGASSWDYKFVIRIDPKDVSKWTSGFSKSNISFKDEKWIKEIVANRMKNWETSSEPECLIRENEKVIMFVFKEEGIIFKRVLNL